MHPKEAEDPSLIQYISSQVSGPIQHKFHEARHGKQGTYQILAWPFCNKTTQKNLNATVRKVLSNPLEYVDNDTEDNDQDNISAANKVTIDRNGKRYRITPFRLICYGSKTKIQNHINHISAHI